MIVKKRLNNNVILAVEDNKELIAFGKGIGFQVYPGDKVDSTVVEKIFVPKENMSLSQMASLISETSGEDIELAEEIVKIGEDILENPVSPNIIFPLLDHINFAIYRQKDDLNIVSPISWEVKKFYPKEMEIGHKAIELIKIRKNIVLPDEEAVSIALHFINAQFDKEPFSLTIKYTKLMDTISSIVKYYFKIEIDKDSFAYSRFLNHIRYYLMRRNERVHLDIINPELYETVMYKLPEEVACTNIIVDYLNNEYGWETPEEEKMYLALHINYLTTRAKKTE